MACNLNINTGDFLSFADYFFDGFVVDWMVRIESINGQTSGGRSYPQNGIHHKPVTAYVKERGSGP